MVWGVEIYRKQDRNQRNVDDFMLPFGGKLKAENRASNNRWEDTSTNDMRS